MAGSRQYCGRESGKDGRTTHHVACLTLEAELDGAAEAAAVEYCHVVSSE